MVDMDDDEDLELAPKGKSKSKLKMIILIGVTVVVLMAASIGGTLFFLAGDDKAMPAAEMAEEPERKAEAKAEQKDDKGERVTVYHQFEPPFVVNFEDKGVVRFLQIGLSAVTNDPAIEDELKKHEPAIRNNLVLLFSSQTYDTLGSREGKESLRKQALEEIQKILKKNTGKTGVQEVYFTSFVIQ